MTHRAVRPLLLAVTCLAAATGTQAQTIVHDSFTGSNNTAITSHTPDAVPSGQGWTALAGSTPTIQSNLVTISSSSAWVIDTITSGVSDAVIGVDVVRQTSEPWGGIIFRATDAGNFFLLKYRYGHIGLHRMQGTNLTDITESIVTSAAQNSRHRLSVELSGSTIKAYWDGTLQFQVTDTFQQTATKHGLAWYPTIDSGTYLDDFDVTVPNGAPSVTGPANQTSGVGDTVSVAIAATDPENDTLTYSATGLPPGLSLNISTGVMSGTVSAGTSGTYTVNTTVTDGVNNVNRSFTWTITGATARRVYDSFTASNNTTMTSRFPDIAPSGIAWVALTGASPIISANAVVASGSSWVVTTVNSTPDATMGVDLLTQQTAPWGGLAFRATNGSNLFLVRYRNGNVGLMRMENGQTTDLASSTVTTTQNGSRHHLSVTLLGPSIKVYWDNVLQYEVTDTFQVTAEKHGLIWYPPLDANTYLDDFEIIEANVAPVITGPSNQTSVEGSPVILPIAATDPNGQALTYQATGLPPGLSLNTANGVITGSIALGSAGTYTVSTTVSDGIVSSSHSFTWTITPVLTAGVRIIDTFTDANGTSLTVHPLDIAPTGVSWAMLTGSSPTIQNNVVTAAGLDWVIPVVTSGVADVTISADVVRGTSEPWGGIVFRATDAENFFVLKYRYGHIGLHRMQGHALTDLEESIVTSAAPNSRHRLSVELSGSTIRVYWDGIFQYQVTDTFQQTATKHGLAWYPPIDGTTTLDTFEISVPSVPEVPSDPLPLNSATGVGVGMTLRWTAAGATAYDLAFGTSSSPPTVTTNLTAATYAPTLQAATTYYWRVTAKNATGNTVGPLWTFTTGAAGVGETVDLKVNRSAPVPVGLPVNFKATGAGGTEPYSYKWRVNPGTGWVTLQDWSTEDTFIWTPATTGPGYLIEVWSRSAGATADVPEASALKAMPVQNKVSAVTLGPSIVSPSMVGQPIVWTASATGGSGPFRYKWRIHDGTTWTVLQEWSTSATVLWTPGSAGAYTLDVWVRSANNVNDAPEAEGLQPYVIFANCQVTLSANGQARYTDASPYWGGSGTLDVAVSNAPCMWRGTSDASWIMLTPGMNQGMGAGAIRWDVLTNPTSAHRTGHITVGDKVITIDQHWHDPEQDYECTFDVQPSQLEFGPDADSMTVYVTASEHCPGWDVHPQNDFIWINDGIHSGDGHVDVHVENNGSFPRAGILLVAGHAVFVSQRGLGGNACAFQFSPGSVTADPGGGTYSVDVATLDDCYWAPVPQDPWIHVSGVVRHGSGPLTFTVDPTTVSHQGRIVIAGGVALIVSQGATTTPGTSPTLPGGLLDEPQDTYLFYYHVDAIGSVRLITDPTGTVVAQYDYTPTGQELAGNADIWNHLKFAGKERDATTQTAGGGALDYFGARYYQNQTGRFTSVDSMQGRLADPQSFNRYVYVRNNPLRFVDPTGLYEVDAACLKDKRCANDAKQFEQERQRALRSTNAGIVAAAGAYGDLNVANGVSVNFANKKAVEAACGQGAAGCVNSGYIGDTATGAMNPVINVLIQSGFGGTALQRTLIHEGSHVSDALGFVQSWDLATMSFDAAKNLTIYDAEFKAYQLEAMVDPTTPHPLRGQLPAQTGALISGFLRASPLYAPRLNNWMFNPEFTKPR